MSLVNANIAVAPGELLGNNSIDDDVLILEHKSNKTRVKVEAIETSSTEGGPCLPLSTAINCVDAVVDPAIVVVEQGKAAKRRMEPTPAQEISAPKEARLDAQQPSYATSALYDPHGLDVPYRPGARRSLLAPPQPLLHPLHPPQPFFFQPPSLVPGPQPQPLEQPPQALGTLRLPDVEACLQRLAVLQEKERLFNDCNAELEELKRKHVTGVKDHLDAQLALKTEVQRLTADNEKLRTQKHAIEQLRDRLRRELHDAKKETTAVDDERQIDRTKLQAAESLIAELRAQLAAEKSKNVAMEVEAGIREEEALELRMKLRQALKANTLQQEMSVSSTSLQKTTELDADEKETLQEDDFAVVIHSSPASPDPSGTDADREVLPESSVPTNYRKGEVVAASTADRKGAKKIRAYFRALKDHGLPVEAILERLRSKHANATSAADGIPAVPKARSANKKT